jgi:predicted Zn-dependent protease with MMP-like domain
MNYTRPPGFDDLQVMVDELLPTLPDEILGYVGDIDDIEVQIEDFPDEALIQEFDLDDVFEMPVLFKSGKEISPGVEKKSANQDDRLIIFRRPVLDLWCETNEDLTVLVRQLLIEELGRVFDFSEDEIEDMISRHHQLLLHVG